MIAFDPFCSLLGERLPEVQDLSTDEVTLPQRFRKRLGCVWVLAFDSLLHNEQTVLKIKQVFRKFQMANSQASEISIFVYHGGLWPLLWWFVANVA